MRICCPHCLTTNNVPEEKLGMHPKCGHCKAELFTGSPYEATETGFQKMIANTDVPVIVDCWADWCAPCKMFAPIYHQACEQLEPHQRLIKLDTQVFSNISNQLRIRSIPTLLVFKGGKEVDRLSGAMPLNDFMRWARQY